MNTSIGGKECADKDIKEIDSKCPKKWRTMNDIQLIIGMTFKQICRQVSERNIPLNITIEAENTAGKLSLIVTIVETLLDQIDRLKGVDQNENVEGAITCKDCRGYEASLQKLENEVRKHIRMEQQMGIFEKSMQESIENYKKEKIQTEKKIDSQKRQIQELKAFTNHFNDKYSKMEHQNEKLKAEIKIIKSSGNDMPSERRNRIGGYESKENKIDWGHKHISLTKNQKQSVTTGIKEKKQERRSVEKRNQSGEKSRISVNSKSAKTMLIMNEKIIQDRSREERKKTIQNKFDYRR